MSIPSSVTGTGGVAGPNSRSQVSRAMEDWPATPYDRLDSSSIRSTSPAAGAAGLSSTSAPERTLSDLPHQHVDDFKPLYPAPSSASSTSRLSQYAHGRAADPAGFSALLGYLPAIVDSPHLASLTARTPGLSSRVPQQDGSVGSSSSGSATARHTPTSKPQRDPRALTALDVGSSVVVSPPVAWSLELASPALLSPTAVQPSLSSPSVSSSPSRPVSHDALGASTIARSPPVVGRHVSAAASRYARVRSGRGATATPSQPGSSDHSGASTPTEDSPIQALARRRALASVHRALEDGPGST